MCCHDVAERKQVTLTPKSGPFLQELRGGPHQGLERIGKTLIVMFVSFRGETNITMREKIRFPYLTTGFEETSDLRRRLTIVSSLIVLGIVGATSWSVLHPSAMLFLASGATEVQVIEVTLGEQLITYYAPGEAYAWRVVVARNLQQHGWVNPPWWRPDMPEVSYAHRSSFWVGAYWSQADLGGAPNLARIRVRRWIEVPWWWYWLQRVAGQKQ
jgi:hypothetical protein